jgi:hypothetical protein
MKFDTMVVFTASLHVMPSSLVDKYQYFRAPCFPYLQNPAVEVTGYFKMLVHVH